jgi:hypothetical protein
MPGLSGVILHESAAQSEGERKVKIHKVRQWLSALYISFFHPRAPNHYYQQRDLQMRAAWPKHIAAVNPSKAANRCHTELFVGSNDLRIT